MGFGDAEWGETPWGDGEASTELALSNVEVLSSNTLLLDFTEPLSMSLANFSIENYLIASLNIKSILAPVDTIAPTEVILVTDRLTVGGTYLVSAAGLESASGNEFNESVTLTFRGRQTKLDKVLTSTPILYDTAPDSAVRQLLTAIHRENDKIGGTEQE